MKLFLELTLFNLMFQGMALFAWVYKRVFQKDFLKITDDYLNEPVLPEAVARRCSVNASGCCFCYANE